MTSGSGPIRLAILEADTPLANTCRTYGSYGGVFKSLLEKAARASDIPVDRLQITGWNVVDDSPDGEVESMGGMYDWKRTRGYPPIDEIDAILITGSRHDSFASTPWITRLVAFTSHAISYPHVRVIGVCFGHQIAARALGATVARSPGPVWEASVCQYTQTSRGKELFGGKETLTIAQMHKDIVCGYPEGVEELGASEKCEVQGMYVKGGLVTVQGHPEFTEEILRELVTVRHEQGVFDDELYGDALGRVGREHDGVVVAQGFLKFLMDE